MAGAPSAAPAQIMRKTPRRSQSAMLFRWLLYRRSISPLIRALVRRSLGANSTRKKIVSRLGSKSVGMVTRHV